MQGRKEGREREEKPSRENGSEGVMGKKWENLREGTMWHERREKG